MILPFLLSQFEKVPYSRKPVLSYGRKIPISTKLRLRRMCAGENFTSELTLLFLKRNLNMGISFSCKRWFFQVDMDAKFEFIIDKKKSY